MGSWVFKNGRFQPITPVAGSWAESVKRVPVTHDALVSCQQIILGGGIDRNLRDAAKAAIDGYRTGLGIDKAVAGVLAKHAASLGSQDRWGR